MVSFEGGVEGVLVDEWWSEEEDERVGRVEDVWEVAVWVFESESESKSKSESDVDMSDLGGDVEEGCFLEAGRGA